jgi:hypothetical protein
MAKSTDDEIRKQLAAGHAESVGLRAKLDFLVKKLTDLEHSKVGPEDPVSDQLAACEAENVGLREGIERCLARIGLLEDAKRARLENVA